jgi:hypothetical protein
MNPYNQDPTASGMGGFPQTPGSYPPPPAYPSYPGMNGESATPPMGAYPQSPGAYPPPTPMYPTGYPATEFGTSPYPTQTTTLSPIWQTRFDFFRRYGSPGSASKETRQALRSMGFWKNYRISQNFLAFLFGPVYFAIKGMWRQALTFLLVGFGVVTTLSLLGVSGGVFRAVGFGFSFMYSITANYAFFRHVNGERSWNPFAGLWKKNS